MPTKYTLTPAETEIIKGPFAVTASTHVIIPCEPITDCETCLFNNFPGSCEQARKDYLYIYYDIPSSCAIPEEPVAIEPPKSKEDDWETIITVDHGKTSRVIAKHLTKEAALALKHEIAEAIKAGASFYENEDTFIRLDDVCIVRIECYC